MSEFIIYYRHNGTIECISPRSLDEYDERKDLIKELIKDNDYIQEIMEGKSSLHSLVVENIDANTIKLKKRIQNNFCQYRFLTVSYQFKFVR